MTKSRYTHSVGLVGVDFVFLYLRHAAELGSIMETANNGTSLRRTCFVFYRNADPHKYLFTYFCFLSVLVELLR